jgi:thiamine pyrophosphokinase
MPQSQPDKTALLVSGSPTGSNPELLKRLAAVCSYCVVVDSGADWAYRADLNIDLMVGDMDSIDPEVLQALRERHIEELVVAPEKDETDLELALIALKERGYENVTATNILGGRIDHELAALGALSRADVFFVGVVDESATIIFLDAEDSERWQFAMRGLAPVGATVSVLALEGPATLTEKGFKYPLKRETLQPLDPRGISNIIKSHGAFIHVHEGKVAVVIHRNSLI